MTQRDSTENDTTLQSLLSRRGFLGVCVTAATAAPVINATAGDDGETAADEDDDSDEDGGDENADNGPFAEVVFKDQVAMKAGGRDVVKVKKYEAESDGYISIHNYDRFAFAEGEDPDDYDVPEPEELDNPVCESLIGITDHFEAGEYKNVKVPLYREDSPAVELGAAEAGDTLDESQPLICIPHNNVTEPEEFNCPDDPNTPDFQENPDEVDGAFRNGPRDVEDIGVSHDLALIVDPTDDKEQIETAKRQLELIREGVLVPQPFDDEAEDVADDEEEADDVAQQIEATIADVTNNEYRADAGLDALDRDEELAAVARAHSQDMIDREFFDHVNPDGEDPFDRIEAAGIDCQASGENIAFRSGLDPENPDEIAEEIAQGWFESDGHRENLLGDYDRQGVGVAIDAGGVVYATHVFCS